MSSTDEEITPFPESPLERPCWYCRRWIRYGEQCIAYSRGELAGKTYHFECHKKRENQ